MRLRLLSFCFALLGFAAPAQAVECSRTVFDGNRYSICTARLEQDDVRLFLNGPDGEPFGQFSAIEQSLRATGKRLVFAMNGGMYHTDRRPVGHYIEDGQELMRVIPNAGPGNFGLVPNGVFCVTSNQAHVIETKAYIANTPECRFASQSGPMLVIDGALHPRFLPDSTSRYIRNGVGTSKDGKTAIFAISDNAVTFHEFGSLFRDHLKTPDALYFDGSVSRLYAPDLGRADVGRRLGPVVGVVESLPTN